MTSYEASCSFIKERWSKVCLWRVRVEGDGVDHLALRREGGRGRKPISQPSRIITDM